MTKLNMRLPCGGEMWLDFVEFPSAVKAGHVDVRVFPHVKCPRTYANGEKRITRVCDGDGRCGPISVEACDSLGPWFDELSKECENCSYRRNAADDKVGKGKGVAEGKGFEKVHGGIIAFILFAIVLVLLLVLCGCSGGVSIIDSPITAIRDQTKVLESIDKSLKAIAAAYGVQDIGR